MAYLHNNLSSVQSFALPPADPSDYYNILPVPPYNGGQDLPLPTPLPSPPPLPTPPPFNPQTPEASSGIEILKPTPLDGYVPDDEGGFFSDWRVWLGVGVVGAAAFLATRK